MSGVSWLAAGIGGLILVALAALALGGAGVTTTTGTPVPGSDIGLAPGPEDVASEKHVSGGRRVLGVRLSSQKYTVRVAFVPPPGCADAIPQSGEELVADGDCIDVALEGTISGIGTTAFGDPIVLVEVNVSESCYNATTIGSPWLPVADECAR